MDTMEDMKLGMVESRFADIIWSHEPLASGELVKLCREELGWKKSTTYTVLKKLCDKGIFRNQDGCVTSLISRQAFHAVQSRRFVEETFDGSLPAFIAAFASQKRLSQGEIREIRHMIDAYEVHGAEDRSAGNGGRESEGTGSGGMENETTGSGSAEGGVLENKGAESGVPESEGSGSGGMDGIGADAPTASGADLFPDRG